MRLIFDLESDGFLDKLTTIHCIEALDVDTKARHSFGPEEIDRGVNLLSQASEIIAHNGISFDVNAIKKLYPDFSTAGIKVTDTLVLSRLFHGDLKNEDHERGWTIERMPKNLYGSHSLKAWGVRLGVHKADFGENTDWSEWSEEMQSYCRQDVTVTHRLWEALASQKWPQASIDFEHNVAEICDRIGKAGWTFDQDAAGALYAQLALERSTLEEEMQDLFPAWVTSEEFIPKASNSRYGYTAGVPVLKEKEIKFNPNSRRHIEYCLRQKYGWKPSVFTMSGDAKVDETVLSSLPYPEAQKLARIFMLGKRISQLGEGRNAWLRLVDNDGKLRHVINPCGTVTGRASSFSPNLQQVPSVRAEYGSECRALFRPQQGYKLVGADLSGLELRCLAHFMQDGGTYAQQILEGDVHQANADMAGITRDQAKTMIYALCYGAGDSRLGSILGKGAKEGKALRERFYKANPAFARLVRQVKQVANQRGHLLGLDGRHLPIRSEHAALNTLLQSAGALICKKWIELIDAEITNNNLDARIITWCHDEVQIETKGDCDHVGHITRRMAQEAGRAFSFSIPIDAEFSVGSCWRDTH